jgi:2-polyprenyl-6-methoxyphenol hydroxylase-like FAD-dependent oxidoreductase
MPVKRADVVVVGGGIGGMTAALAARDLVAFRELWSAALPSAAPVLAGVGGFDELLLNDVVRVDCRRWSDGRLVLLGDAAHAMALSGGRRRPGWDSERRAGPNRGGGRS